MNGDIQSILKQLYDENIDSLYRYAYFKLQSSEEEAIDIVQESFLKLGKELQSGKKIENPKSYIYRIVSHKIIDFYRKNTPSSLDAQMEQYGDIYEDDTDLQEDTHVKMEVEKLYKVLDTLPESDKDIFILRYVEDISPKEIAQIHDIDVNSLTVKLHRLKSKVVEIFKNT